jgi:hypothetical protein
MSKPWTPWWEAQGSYIPQSVCDKHNAALAAEREKFKAYVASVNHADRHNAKWQKRAEKAEQQLAAERENAEKAAVRAEQGQIQLASEREKRKPLVDALEMLSYDADGVPIMWPSQQTRDDALAKVNRDAETD